MRIVNATPDIDHAATRRWKDAQYLRHLTDARDICTDRDTSLLLSGLIEYAKCTHDDADEMEQLADRIEADAALLTDMLREGVEHLRDPVAQAEFWRAD